jgi:hypothetical protein
MYGLDRYYDDVKEPPTCNVVYVFTNNQKDFLSEQLIEKFQTDAGVKIHFVQSRKGKSKIKDMKYTDFIKKLIGDTTGVIISSVTVGFEEKIIEEEEINVFEVAYISADQFPADLSSFLIKKTYDKKDFEESVRRNVIVMLTQSLHVKIDEKSFSFNLEYLRPIDQISVELMYFEGGQYYTPISIEIEYDSGKSDLLKPPAFLIPNDFVEIGLNQWDEVIYSLRGNYEIQIIEFLERSLNRRITADLLEYDV